MKNEEAPTIFPENLGHFVLKTMVFDCLRCLTPKGKQPFKIQFFDG